METDPRTDNQEWWGKKNGLAICSKGQRGERLTTGADPPIVGGPREKCVLRKGHLGFGGGGDFNDFWHKERLELNT